jgi:hypothetical protein
MGGIGNSLAAGSLHMEFLETTDHAQQRQMKSGERCTRPSPSQCWAYRLFQLVEVPREVQNVTSDVVARGSKFLVHTWFPQSLANNSRHTSKHVAKQGMTPNGSSLSKQPRCGRA